MFHPHLLQNKFALITGGGSGLGLSMAKRFAELGATIAVCGRNADRLAKAGQEIQQAGNGREAITFVCDVRDYQAVVTAIDTLVAQHGLPDILVNNAAGNFLAATEDLSPGGFDAVVKIVLYGTFNCTQVLGKKWIAAHRRGSILNIVTTYAWNGSAFVVPSACAKAGVLAMTRSLAVEWAAYGIRLNAIAPGPFPTEGAWQRLLPTKEIAEQARQRIPAGRFGEHQELANLAVFLVAEGVDFITGEVVTIDGGEALAGAGQFSQFIQQDREQFKRLLAMMRGK
ncbi:MAG: SDR family oxidoreductase [candidate division KSB1 bacterium]|nr:SDR family oxidoreductase [candidate division KSB1 bacterium]MDZ7273446.1 SDR family oxidoreductase [candidate division KSB1 bacterium]MDZ7286962.1 SDR family oxidoreductase [candidate division KSB1 bacterium]MDZ7299685.1 SDR family oxidoreductase [candidate division KSB1 bacterium]MDZ7307949.1 SDR family oxidoreductase [candidate division KSB1 bacterium]